jgi:hypothetical protein
MTIKTKSAISMLTQILNTICLQYKGVSESILTIQNVRLPGKGDDSNFIEIRLHKICRTAFMYTIMTAEDNNHYVN